jgi:hypothetical protein
MVRGACTAAALLLLFTTATLADEDPEGYGYGCQKKLDAVCPGWEVATRR